MGRFGSDAQDMPLGREELLGRERARLVQPRQPSQLGDDIGRRLWNRGRWQGTGRDVGQGTARPEGDQLPGTPGYWEGSYFAGGEGNLRTPCLVRWPGHIPAGKATRSCTWGYLYWMGPQLYGVKWHNFKLVLVAQRYMQDAAAKLPTPRLINLTTDPQEREPVSLPYLHSWVRRSTTSPHHQRPSSKTDERHVLSSVAWPIMAVLCLVFGIKLIGDSIGILA